MLEKLQKYENLGSPKYFFELLTLLAKKDYHWTLFNLEEYFNNRIIDGYVIFDGCLPFIMAIGAITVNSKGLVVINPILIPSINNERYLTISLLKLLISSLRGDEIFNSIFSPEFLSYDVLYRFIQVDRSAFYPRFANLCQLLVEFCFLYHHPDKKIRKLIINSAYKKLFDTELLPIIKKRKLGIADYKELIDKYQILGEEAEDFVLMFEKQRLRSHKFIQKVEIISDYDIGAGYDIVSFNDIDSMDYNRFIEVKSYSKVPSFHWSRNEIEISRVYGDKYYLYLVDRINLKNSRYIPFIIQNPFRSVFGNSTVWSKSVDSYFFTKT